MRIFSRVRLIAAGVVFSTLFAVNAPLALYTALSSDKAFLPETRVEIEVFRYVLLAIAAGLFLTAALWYGIRRSSWGMAIAEDFEDYCQSARPFDSLVRRPAFVIAWSGVMLAVFAGLLATVRLSFTYQDKGVRWFDILALEDGIWETATALGLLGAGIVLMWGILKYPQGRQLRWSCVALAFGLLLCFAAGEEVSWGQRWLGYGTPEIIKNVNVQEEFTVHNIGGRWANQVMILFFLTYIGIAPLMGAVFVDVRFAFDRVRIPLAPLWLAPWAFIGILFDERDVFSRLWGYPPWYLDEARETLFGVAMLGVMIHGVLSWQKE